MAFAAWMAGLWYLPRLFVYHSQVAAGSEASEKYKIMERRLLRGIATPAMIAALGFGIALATAEGQWSAGWLHAKTALVALPPSATASWPGSSGSLRRIDGLRANGAFAGSMRCRRCCSLAS